MAAYQASGKIRTVAGATLDFQQEDDVKTSGTFHMPINIKKKWHYFVLIVQLYIW